MYNLNVFNNMNTRILNERTVKDGNLSRKKETFVGPPDISSDKWPNNTLIFGSKYQEKRWGNKF